MLLSAVAYTDPDIIAFLAMPKRRLRHASIPPTLYGSLLVSEQQFPRYWSTIWADVLLASIEENTRSSLLNGVEKLYQVVVEESGKDQLDSIISSLDFEALEAVLGGMLSRLRNESAVYGVDRDGMWQSALRFINDIVTYLSHQHPDKQASLTANLQRLERLYGQIVPTPPRPPDPIRALPAEVVEDLYDIFNPTSVRNPFRTEALRYRNYLIFLLLLHLGLRRGEILILPVDAVKDDFDPYNGEVRYWINIDKASYENEDPRYDFPGIKTATSKRQLPLSREIVNLIDTYVNNYRGRCYHSFLFNSQKNSPLSAPSVGKIFTIVNSNISSRSQKMLTDRGVTGITPHDLRHTAAVVRLGKYVSKGIDMDAAIEKLRVFFGWSPTSQMPRHYARAYFETSLAEIWNEDFDSYVDTLRDIIGDA